LGDKPIPLVVVLVGSDVAPLKALAEAVELRSDIDFEMDDR
jgi:hypothetical protein